MQQFKLPHNRCHDHIKEDLTKAQMGKYKILRIYNTSTCALHDMSALIRMYIHQTN